MIAPSVSFDPATTTPMWALKGGLSVDDVKALLVSDVAELQSLYRLRADDEAEAKVQGRQPDFRLRQLITGWENTQDTHWSWLREMTHGGSNGTEAERLGTEAVG